MITILTVRGTGEPQNGPSNFLTNVTRQLDPAKYDVANVVDVLYPASIGFVNSENNIVGVSEADSIAAGQGAIAAAVRATPNLVGIIGYSLGASTVSRFLESKARGLYGDCELAWAATVANPWRARGESLDHTDIGWGISGEHGRWPALRTYSVANPRDGITCCPGNSPLRTLADAVSNFTFAGLEWSEALAYRLADNGWQAANANPLDYWNIWERYYTAAALVRGYLYDGQHEAHYINDGYLNRLATALNAF